MKKMMVIASGLLVLGACSEEPQAEVQPVPSGAVSGETVANKLEQAAEQSDPEAAEVLEDAADQARGRASMAPVDEPGSFAQDAMQEAGKAAVAE